ncbi:MAG TPA: hypothetical protein VEI97_06495, partial [bacterium]|nr:hypothetical protein [bacterium]
MSTHFNYEPELIERTIQVEVRPEEFAHNVVPLPVVERFFQDELARGLRLRSWVAEQICSAADGLRIILTARFAPPG